MPIAMELGNNLLRGIRVVDMTRVLAGPFATMILGDLGAEILKIEETRHGDDTRDWGPPFLGEESAYFMSINRNKKSIAVDIKHKRGVGIIHKLVENSDVLVENFIPGKLDKLGLGFDSLRKVNKGLVYCSITGYGPDGPYANRGGYDVIAASVGGLNHITGPRDGEPCRVGVAMTDITTGLFAYGSILAALLNRKETGLGQKIDCNLLSTQVAVLTHIASSYLNADVKPSRWGTGHPSIVPYQSFKTKDDRFLTVGAGNNKQFTVMCKKLGLDHLIDDPKYSDNSTRVEHRNELIEILSTKFVEKTCDEWMFELEGVGFPYGPINDIEQAFCDPQVIHNRMIMEMDHRRCERKVRIPSPPVIFNNDKVANQRYKLPPPMLGEHSRQVLKEVINLSDAEINKLMELGVVADGANY